MRRNTSFWLDTDNASDHQLLKYIDKLKRQRAFSETVRCALRLMIALEEDADLAFLLREYPWIAQALGYAYAPKSDTVSKLNAIEALLSERNTSAQVANIPPSSSGNLSQFKPSQVDLLENSLNIKKADSSKNNSAYNLQISMAKMSGALSSLPDVVIQYGIERGDIPTNWREIEATRQVANAAKAQQPSPKSSFKTKRQKTESLITIAEDLPHSDDQGGPKPIGGAEVALDAPSFDDLDFDLQ